MVYSKIKTYLFKMDKELQKQMSKKYNRSTTQVLWLYNLCDGDIEKYEKIEQKIKEKHIMFCPDDKDDVEEILG